MKLPIDIQLSIIHNVDSIQELVNMCSTNAEINSLCKKHTSSIFKTLVTNKSFRDSFFDRFSDLLEHSDYERLLDLLNFYPVGTLLPLDNLNDAQNKLYYIFKSIHSYEDHQYTHSNLIILSKLLFFPSNHIVSTLELDKFEAIYFDNTLHYFHPLLDDLLAFHIIMLDKMSFQQVHNIEADFVKDIINAIRYLYVSEKLLSFYRNILNTLFKINPSHFQNTLFHIIYDEEELSFEDSIDSEEVQDYYGDTYETFREMYQFYGLEQIRQSILHSI